MISRRGLLGSAAVLASASAVSGRIQAASIPEAPTTRTNTMQPPIFPIGGPDYQPVVTLNGWTLPWRMNGDWKEFHLVAEPVVREMAPGMKANLWGYNGQSPGPTVEAVEGDSSDLRHQSATRAYHHSLARHVASERNGRCRRSHTAAHQTRQDVRL